MKKIFILGMLLGLLVGGMYWYGKYMQLYENYLQVVKYASRY